MMQNEENQTEKLRLLETELEKIKKEGHKRKKLLMDQQHLIEAGADNFHKVSLVTDGGALCTHSVYTICAQAVRYFNT